MPNYPIFARADHDYNYWPRARRPTAGVGGGGQERIGRPPIRIAPAPWFLWIFRSDNGQIGNWGEIDNCNVPITWQRFNFMLTGAVIINPILHIK